MSKLIQPIINTILFVAIAGFCVFSYIQNKEQQQNYQDLIDAQNSEINFLHQRINDMSIDDRVTNMEADIILIKAKLKIKD